jgi:hypothetical protein
MVGYVFKINDKIYVTEYLGDGQYSDGHPITNDKPYKELGHDQLSFVSINKEDRPNGDVSYILQDHQRMTICNKDTPYVTVGEFLMEVECRERLGEITEDMAKNFDLEI